MQADLRERLELLAQTQTLLVACDYDGTMAEIVAEPSAATPETRVLHALRACSKIADTVTAIVSGRSYRDLVELVGSDGPELKVGSHGAEWLHEGISLNPQQRKLRDRLITAITKIAKTHPNLHCEFKPGGVALHVRSVEAALGDLAIAEAERTCGTLPGVQVKHGSKVVEFMVLLADKGSAVQKVRQETSATGVIFVGDDLTDEDVFHSLAPPDVAVKVGLGATAAPHRVAGVAEVASMLEALASFRRAAERNS